FRQALARLRRGRARRRARRLRRARAPLRQDVRAARASQTEGGLMLKQRIITAVILLAILLPALFWPSPGPFSAVVLVLIGYAAGRAFGLKFTKTKLAPSISPGKSWEGAWGGTVGVLVLGIAWAIADHLLGAQVPSLYSRLPWWLLPVVAVFLTAMSIVGDLV